MSRRLRRYAAVLGVRHLCFAVAIIYAHDLMQRSAGFRFIFGGVVPWWVWVGIYAAVGFLSLSSLALKADNGVRAAGGLAAVLGAVWAVNFALSFVFDRGRVSPLAVLLFGFLAIKDYIILGTPMSAEFDEIAERIVAERDAAHAAATA
jgi:hypothetical protein